jgi:predicted dehydrogenase
MDAESVPKRGEPRRRPRPVRKRKLRYAVVGLGCFAEDAVLPGFAHAGDSELVALVSGDGTKREELGRRYEVSRTYSYEQYDDCLESGDIEAVYLAVPNSEHRRFAVRAAEAGVHILAEKPLAVTEEDCLEMIHAAEAHRIKLMVAYRLHFESANLKAIEIVRSGRLGDLRFFHSIVSQQVREGDIRLRLALGGGTLYDLGVYPINAARHLFRDEPVEVTAFSADIGEPRFREVDEMTSAVLRFPHERLAAFTVSFGAADISMFRIAGTEGELKAEPAFEHATDRAFVVTIGGRSREHVFPKVDQAGAEITYFSRCVLEDKDPEPSGWEGLADVRVVRALYRSAMEGHPVRLPPFSRPRRPEPEQEIDRPGTEQPDLVHAGPSRRRKRLEQGGG